MKTVESSNDGRHRPVPNNAAAPTKMRSTWAWSALGSLALAAVGACGDDAGASDDEAAFCDDFAAVEASFADFPWDAGPDAVSTYFDDTVAPALDQVAESKPDDLADEIDTMVTSVRAFGESQDFAALETAEMAEAERAVNDFLFADCPGEKLEIAAVDYEFGGIPDEVSAGRVLVRFGNEGDEEHEMLLARRLPGTTEPVHELLALADDEIDEKLELLGGVGASPGASDIGIFDLAAGDYIAVCFIPTGTTAETEGDGPPHAEHGMITEFRVT